jgi:hypothetical protein
MSTSYHLWLKPEGPAYGALAQTIEGLARELGAPTFEPHITLLGYLDGTVHAHVSRTRLLAQQLNPFEIVLAEPAYQNEYFRCIFMTARQLPSIMRANALARAIFVSPDEIYMPHVSLVYGIYPDTLKQEIIARLPVAVRAAFTVSAVHLIGADSTNPKDWREILVAPMGRSDN